MPHPTASRLALIGLLALAWPAPSRSQAQDPAVLTITVRDAVSGDPVPNATVNIADARVAGRTNRDGVWRSARMAPGSHLVQVSRLGYVASQANLDLGPGSQVERTLVLAPEAVAVGGVSARAERRSPVLETRGFYDRRRRGMGAFITRERLDQLRPTRTADIFYHMRGFAVKRDRLGRPFVVTARGGASLSNDCVAPLVFMDGTAISTGETSYMDFVNPEAIEAIEAFAGPSSTPDEYRLPGAACGVILVWTRNSS